MIWIIGIFVYIVGLFLSVLVVMTKIDFQSSSDWIKVIFWPITVVIYFLGLLIWLLIWLPRKLFQGIRFCFCEIKDFFVDVFSSAIDDED